MKKSNNRPNLCCIGHITLDKIVTPRMSVHMPGGTAFYFAHALRHLSHPSFSLVTSLGETEMSAVDELRAKGVDVTVVPSHRSVYFENRYGENQNSRTQRVLALADPFSVEKLRGVEADIYHLGTLLAEDFSLDVIKYLSTKGAVSVDAQGYLRKVVGETVIPVDWTWKKEAMPYISFIKANETEMEVLTGKVNPHEAARVLAGWGCKEVLLTLGDKGSCIYSKGVFYDIPAFPPADVVDATGCGDTYMAGYLYRRSLGESCYDAGVFAAAMCTIKLSASGPFSATEDDVLSIMQSVCLENVC